MNHKEYKHFSKEWFWDEGLLPLIMLLVGVFLLFPLRIFKWSYFLCSWFYSHGFEVLKLAFWFIVSLFIAVWIILKFVMINDVFVINIKGTWIYGISFLIFLYAYFKYARRELREYCKQRVLDEIDLFDYISSKLYDDKEYDELVKFTEEKISQHPNCPSFIYWLAKGKYQQGRLEDSLELFKELERMHPDFYESFEFGEAVNCVNQIKYKQYQMKSENLINVPLFL